MPMKLRTLPKRTAAPARMLLMLAAVLLSVSPAVLCAQSVSFAGATTVIPLPGLSGAQGIVVDRAGNIFGAFNSRVVEITPAGVQTTVPFTGLNGVSGLALDTAGDLFAADTANSRVLKLTPAGVQTTVYTTPDGVFPSGMTMDGAGNLFILYGSGSMATDSSAVVKIAPGSGGPGTGPVTVQPAELVFPAAILVDGAGNFYITDQGPLTVLKLTPEGVQTTVVTGLKRPTGLAMDAVGNIYVGDSEGHQLVKLPADGSPQIQVPISIPTSPEALAMTADGNLVIADDVPSRLLEVYLVSPNFNSVNVCQAGQTAPSPCSAMLTLNYNVNADGDLGTAKVLTQGAPNLDFTLAAGGTCAGAVTAGSTCTVNVTFAPQLAGVRAGAVQLTDTSGNLLATTAVYGVGLGSQIAYGPGTQIPLNLSGGGFSDAHAVAVDAAGNIFIADSSNNRVVKIPVGGGPQTTVGTGLNEPFGVAVDGAGNVFIADNRNARVVEVPSGGGAQITLPVSGLTDPFGLALDGAGDLFISDGDNENVVKVPAGGGPQTIVASDGFEGVAGIAVDGLGNLFIADSIHNRIVESPAGGGPLITLPVTGLSEPFGVAVDAAGDLFVTDFFNNRVVELPAGGGAQITVATGVSLPTGVAVSGAGDVFVVGNALFEIQHSQPPSFSFATTAGGSTSTDSPQSVTVQSIGNQPLNAIAPGLSIGPSFAQVAGSGTPADCTSSFSLMPGATCNMSISFTPVAGGLIQSAAVLTDNALNGNPAAQSITLTGTGQDVTPTLSFGPIANQAFGAAPFVVGATSNSTGAITYSVVSGPATISGNIVTITGVGTVALQASQAAADGYIAATAQASFMVSAEIPTLTLAAIANQTYGTAPFAVSATSNSTGAIAYSIVSGPATISGNIVTLTGAGSVTLQASQAAAGNFAASTAQTSFTVNATKPTLTFAAIANQTYGATPFAVSATSNSTGAITYSVVSGPATISGNIVTLTGAGSVTLQASQVAAGNYAAATAQTSFTVTAAKPTLTFAAIANQNYGAAPFAVSATSNSTGAITYSVVSGPATISGNTVTLTGAGSVTLQASQVAAGNFAAASAQTSFAVNKEPQSITFHSIASQMLGTSVTVSASSSSGLAVSFTSLTTSVCTVSSTQVTLLNTGTCTIQASQAGTANYAAATPVTQSFTVLPGAGFTITPIPTKETIKRGVLGAFILQLNSVKGFNGNVTLNCSGGPAGAKCADFPQTVKVNGVALALSGILFPAKTTPGTYTITFTGTSGTLTNTATAEFTVLK
jgi:NHL repeat